MGLLPVYSSEFGCADWNLGCKRAAAIMSLVHTAMLNAHDPSAYHKGVLERLPTQPASKVDELLPHRWLPLATAHSGIRGEVKMTSPDATETRTLPNILQCLQWIGAAEVRDLGVGFAQQNLICGHMAHIRGLCASEHLSGSNNTQAVDMPAALHIESHHG